MKIITNVFDYKTTEGTDYSVTVTVGNKQPGVITMIKPDGGSDTKQDVFSNYPIGKASDIKGKNLIISTVITDVQENTDMTSLAIDINGVNFKTLADSVEHNHDLITYQTVIKFI